NKRTKDARSRVLAQDFSRGEKDRPYCVSRHQISMSPIVEHRPIDIVVVESDRGGIAGQGCLKAHGVSLRLRHHRRGEEQARNVLGFDAWSESTTAEVEKNDSKDN